MFKFPDDIRPFVASLADLMLEANSRETGKWASQDGGVYGLAQKTISAIIREVCGPLAAFRWVGHFDLAANEKPIDDVEAAVQAFLDGLAESDS